MPDALPARLGRFELLRPLGRGGMGQVYLAKDPAIGREVALKTISPEMVQTPKARERFLNEAKAAGALSHPNLVTIHEFGEDQGVLYLVMELLEGEDLSSLLRRRALAPAQALEIMAQVCDGLAYAHAKGVLHRDVKPSNVRVVEQSGRRVAKLLDFGVARLPDSQLTGTGDRVGTLSYMAPEYLRGGQPTVQCDLYPVGMMLHEALTGQLPSLGLTLPRGLGRLPAPSPSGTVSELPTRLVPLVHRALEADPAARFPSAEAFAAALRGAAKQDATGTERLALPPLPEPEPRSRAPFAWIAALLLLGGGVLWFFERRDPAPPSGAAPAVSTPLRPEPAAGSAQVPKPAAPLLPPVVATAGNPPSPQWPQTAPVPETSTRAADPPPAPADLGPAEAEVQRQPQDAWGQAEHRLQEQPTDGRALALRVASLYWMGRYDEMLTALQAAQGAGLNGDRLGGYTVIHNMLDAERDSHRIPMDLFAKMRPYLPAPRGEQQPPRR